MLAGPGRALSNRARRRGRRSARRRGPLCRRPRPRHRVSWTSRRRSRWRPCWRAHGADPGVGPRTTQIAQRHRRRRHHGRGGRCPGETARARGGFVGLGVAAKCALDGVLSGLFCLRPSSAHVGGAAQAERPGTRRPRARAPSGPPSPDPGPPPARPRRHGGSPARPSEDRPAPGQLRTSSTRSAIRPRPSTPRAGRGAGRPPAHGCWRSLRHAAVNRQPRWSASPSRPICGHPSVVGNNGPAQCRSKTADGLGAPCARSRDDQALGGGAGEGGERARVHRLEDGLDAVPWPAVAAPGGSSPGPPNSGSRKARLACTGPGPTGPPSPRRPGGWPASASSSGLFVGHAGVDRPAHGAAEQAGLLDGLGRADMMQLGGPVGGAHDERNPGQMGLHDRRMNPDCRRPARGDEHRRATGGKPDPEGEKGRRALVQPYVQRDPALARQGHHERGRTRTRAHDGVGQPGAHPLVDERGREVAATVTGDVLRPPRAGPGHGRSICTRRVAGVDRGSSSSTGSPRRAPRGRPSAGSSKATSRSSCRTFPATAALRCPSAARTSTRPPGSRRGGRQGRLRRLLARRPVLPAPGAPGTGPRRAPRHRRGAPGHPRRRPSAGSAAPRTTRRAAELEGAATRSWPSSSMPGSPGRCSPT